MSISTKANLLMHPIRARILFVLASRELTTRQIAQALPDISQASVYRHVHILADAGLLRIVREIPVRGVVERVYAFSMEEATLDVSKMTDETSTDFLRLFKVFVDALLSQFRLYAAHEDANPREDGVAFWGEMLYLTPKERDDLKYALHAATRPYKENGPDAERARCYIGRIVLPDKSDNETRSAK